MDEHVFQIPASISRITTMLNYWRLQFDTQETISGDQMKVISEWMNKVGWLSFAIRQIDAQDIVDLPSIKSIEDGRKSKAQIQRNVLYRIWERDNEGMNDFEIYYNIKMDRNINYLKEKYLI